MSYWTKEEFNKFLDCVMNKHTSVVGFSLLFWLGLRLGEMMALYPSDFNFEKSTVSITKTYSQQFGILDPKTDNSRRVLKVPPFLLELVKEYIDRIYGIDMNDRLFQVGKNYWEYEFQRGINSSGVKKIRIHDLRHSFAAMCCSNNIPMKILSELLGHAEINSTMIYAHFYPNKKDEVIDFLQQQYDEGQRCQD